MATQAIETDNSNGTAGGRVGVLPIDDLAAAPAKMRAGPSCMASAGCAVSCPRFAQCGSPDRFARRSCVTADQGVGA
jgi:hypothetical protein